MAQTVVDVHHLVLFIALFATWMGLYFYDHFQDTGVSLGKNAIVLNSSSVVKAAIYANDEHHERAMVKVAQQQNLCNPKFDRPAWEPRCRVLVAWEMFAGRITKEQYVEAFQSKGMTYKLVDKPGGMFQKYTAEMAWDPAMVTASNYKDIKFHHQHYGELKLWPIAAWAVCAREERSLSEVEAQPELCLETIREELYQYATFIEWSLKQLDEFKPTVVVVAQGHYHFAAGFRVAAILQGLHLVALETPINNRRLVWSTISGISVDRGVERNLYWRYSEFVRAEIAQAEVRKYLERVKQSKMLVHASPENTDALDEWLATKPRGQKILAYVGQVYTDTAVVLNIASGFTSQADIIWTVAQWCVDKNQPFIVKFHPRETPPKDLLPIYGPRLNHLTLRRLREKYDWDGLLANNSDLILADNFNSIDTYAILDAVDAVVTINSGSGLEALLKGKEVVLAGHAYYGGMGFTHHVSDPANMRSTLSEVMGRHPTKLNIGDSVAKFFFVFNRWATIPKKADAVVERSCGFPGQWPLPKSQFCDEDDQDEELGTLI
eukprot:CAMPEP_0117667544 /NCGR_PEP_ID=MMETSP0804-20121206/11031_1 /TAXON_ID=1074897 /ORGANISM="Tetraselmis astigmatica, Strain CCMP880" /LENGTH=548 /DNA_ID=CAMNT_0005475293 /DNA_START=274 /DNA_END=1921 /DNA_ORIENTATION=-